MKNKRRKFLIALVGLLVMAMLTAIAYRKYHRWHPGKLPTPDREIVYKEINGVQLKLYAFEPKTTSFGAPLPAVLLFHGGGWKDCFATDEIPQAKEFANRGFMAFSGEYRVLDREGTSPFESVKDAKSAIRYLRSHAKELGIDPNRIFAGGESAGGHIPLAAAMFDNIVSEDKDQSVSSAPNALLLWNPVLDATMTGYAAGAERLGKRAEEISPAHHIRPGLPPTIIFHSTGDDCTPYENSVRYTDLATKAGNRVVLYTFEKRRHGFANNTSTRSYVPDNVEFYRTIELAECFLASQGLLQPPPIPAPSH